MTGGLSSITVDFGTGLFGAVFGLGFFDGLPLHIGRRIQATALERDDVIDHVSGGHAGGLAGSWAGVLLLERPAGSA